MPVDSFWWQGLEGTRVLTHYSSWGRARFETSAQKWADLSEGGYGVSLLNDCKHGHDVRDNVLRISLLRAPTEPNPEADQGERRVPWNSSAGQWPAAGPCLLGQSPGGLATARFVAHGLAVGASLAAVHTTSPSVIASGAATPDTPTGLPRPEGHRGSQ